MAAIDGEPVAAHPMRVGRIRVTRVVTAHDPSRVMNARTARGQVIGGVTAGMRSLPITRDKLL